MNGTSTEANAASEPQTEAPHRRLRVFVLSAFSTIGGPLPKLTPLLADGLRGCGCDIAVEGWSAHTAGAGTLGNKVHSRSRGSVKIHRRMRDWKPDVIYVAIAHSWRALSRDLPLALRLPRGNPPVVLHLRGSESHRLQEPSNRAFRVASRALVRRAATVLLLSREEEREWRRFCPEVRYEVVLNPFLPACPSRDRL